MGAIDPYDVERLSEMLHGLVRGRGTVHRATLEQRMTFALVPTDGMPGSPILVTVAGDEAVITAGLGATKHFSCAGYQDEEHVIEVVEAIMDGGATQYLLPDGPDAPFVVRLNVVGPWGSLSSDTTGAIRIGPLPRWSTQGDQAVHDRSSDV